MYRILILLAAVALAATLFGNIAAADDVPCCGGQPGETSPETSRRFQAAKKTDAGVAGEVVRFEPTSLKQGLNFLRRDSAKYSLFVKATNGRLLEYVVRDPRGKVLETRFVRRVSAASKKTTCWACGVDAEGNRHCWQVPCPDIVGPWKPAAILTPGGATIRAR